MKTNISIRTLRQNFSIATIFITVCIASIITTKAVANIHIAPDAQQVNAADSLKEVKAGVLSVGYAEYGPRNGQPVVLLHGWPYGIESYIKASTILADNGYHVFVPYARGFGSTRFLSGKTMRSGEPAALAQDLIDFMDALHIQKAIIGGFDWGARTADIIAALYPERCTALVAVSGYLIGDPKYGNKPLPPKAELAWWYQFYFATARGEEGYRANTLEFAKLIWQLASPAWHFDDQTFYREAKGLENSDQVAITIHNYRYRLELAASDPTYASLEARIDRLPNIAVPTVTLEGDVNGAPHPQPADYRNKYIGKYMHHIVKGGIGHDLPAEAPEAFADAIIEAGKMAK